LKTLLIDNYDSFTYNLFQLLGEIGGEEPIVVRNDEASWEELAGLPFDNVVVSPGPGRPEREADFGVCGEAIRRCDAPLLGVCLGHQGLGWAHGARVEPAPEAVHGRLSLVRHDGSPLFDGIPSEFRAVRYHSLQVAQPLPPELRRIAWTEDGVTMALAHRERPLWGVQFHPESICAEHGRQLLTNFRDLSAASCLSPGGSHLAGGRRGSSGAAGGDDGGTPERADTQSAALISAALVRAGVPPSSPPLELVVRRLDGLVDAEAAFVHLYGESENAFWLDSSRPGADARFSFLGDDSGPLAATVSYDVAAGEVRIERGAGETPGQERGGVELRRESIFDYLSRETGRLPRDPDLPFDFDCGFVGWLGYELKAECGGEAAHESPLPDAAFVFADRMIALDHAEERTYLLCVAEAGDAEEAERWLAATAARLRSLPPVADPVGSGRGAEADPHVDPDPIGGDGGADPDPVAFRLGRSRERYLEEIAECKRLLAQGETYEVCLTNRVVAAVEPEPLALYRRLRRVNPAPFSAFLRIGGTAVLSSSPERFLSVGRDRQAEARPIKGTCRRGATAAEDARLAEELRRDEKNRAENLMIADLLRNDLGAVCEIGSVHAPRLMEVESYETVHQLVSTVRGRLREDLDAPECIRACFPPGSMTGAPKRRTMRILDELEGEARGIYSGAIGYLGASGGCDLAVTIRTIVLADGEATIGTGGAIVMQSEPEAECEEALLKARAPMLAIDPRLAPSPYSRTRFAASISRVTPRKSTTSGAAATTAS
jgi:para-aminobenzoate synthetase